MSPARPAPSTENRSTGYSKTAFTRRRRPAGEDRVAPLSAHRRGRPGPARPSSAISRVGAGTLAVATLLGGMVALDATGAGAATVPYAVGFDDSVPAIAPGGATDLYLDCPGNEGVAVPVTVTDPSADVTVHDVLTIISGGEPRVFVTVGAGGTFTATELGTWSVSVACVGFDPYVSTFEVLAPALTVATRLDRDYDCTTDDTAFLVGDRERVCLTITNNTDKDLRRIGAMTDGSGSFSYPAAGEVGPGETFETAVASDALADFGGGSLDGITVWAELDTPDSDLFAVSDTQSFGYGPLGAPLALTATTGLDASTACAADGGLADRTVAAGTPVYLCYTVTNTSGVTYHFHDVDDSVLGSLEAGLENDLGTGASMTSGPTQPLLPAASATHTGTWSSSLDDEEGYSGLPEGFVATATASATVTVLAPPTPPTTPTPTPTTTPTTAPVRPVAVTTTAAPAVAVVATPRMAG